MRPDIDLLIVGGGIVGLASAWTFLDKHPGANVVVVEKENGVGQHQSGRNSGVIHSAVYYKPGSLKAKNCRHGREMLLAFCREHGLPHEVCGKVIVALDEDEMDRLGALHERGRLNGVDCDLIDRAHLLDREPACAGIGALLVRDAGIVDFPGVCRRLAELIGDAGGEVRTGVRVRRLVVDNGGVVATTDTQPIHARRAVNAAGLHSDRLARASGVQSGIRLVPFRGEYRELTPDARHLCRHLIYPVPDPRFPFLGVHFTRMTDGNVECGPNAVPALAREGYSWLHINPRDIAETITSHAWRKMARRYWRTGASEIFRSLNNGAFLRAVQRLIPTIRAEQLLATRAGVRAQALRPDGSMLDDFAIETLGRVEHVINAPSPAATSALSIGETIVDRLDTSGP